jgi:hypothetical protein
LRRASRISCFRAEMGNWRSIAIDVTAPRRCSTSAAETAACSISLLIRPWSPRRVTRGFFNRRWMSRRSFSVHRGRSALISAASL